MPGWQDKCQSATPDDILRWPQQFADHTNTGILCGKIGGIDIDICDPDISAERIARAQGLFGATSLIRIGRAPKTLLVYRLEVPHDKFSTPELWFGDDVDNREMKAQVEFLGSPRQQFVGYGIHPDTRESYCWPEKSLLDIPLADIPAVTLDILQQFCTETEQVLRAAGARSRSEIQEDIKQREGQGYDAAGVRSVEKPNYETVADALDHIPNDADRPLWINIGYAIYDGLGEAGWSLFENWSKQYSGYNPKHTIEAWRSFKKRRSITIGTLFFHAGQRGWKSQGRSSSANGKAKPEDRTKAQSKPETPRRLIRELPPAEAFPIDALGDVLGNAARGIQDRVQAPMAICAKSVLAAATLAVQGYADMELPTEGVVPVSGFFLSVAESGERKSVVDKIALKAIRKREAVLLAEYDERMPQYKNAVVAWEKARDFAVKKANGDGAAIRAALNALGPEPVAPLMSMLTCSEPTFEGLCKLFAAGQPSMGIFSDEGGQFIGGHGMNDEAIKRTATGLSKFWGGEPVDRVRAGDGVLVLSGRRLSMHLMVQPDIATELLSNQYLLNQGLLSRYLVSAPASTAGSRPWHEPAEKSNVVIQHYENVLLNILKRPLPLVAGRMNELSAPAMKLAPSARNMWIDFSDATDSQLKPDGALAAVKGLANKLPEHAARMAAVLALVENIEAREVSADHMSAGIVLAQYYAGEALRMFEASRIGDELRLAQRLLDWLIGAWTEPLISLPDIYQFGPRPIRDKALATKLAAILVDHGWFIPVEGGAEIDGNYRREVFRIIKG
jgi:hypothetical protein